MFSPSDIMPSNITDLVCVLNSTNYKEWAIEMKTYLQSQDHWYVIVNKDNCRPTVDGI